MKLDAKFYGDIYKVKDGSIVPEDQYIVFLIKDNAFAAILPSYLDKCIELGCDQEQIKAVERMIARGFKWRANHINMLKIPDAANENLLDS